MRPIYLLCDKVLRYCIDKKNINRSVSQSEYGIFDIDFWEFEDVIGILMDDGYLDKAGYQSYTYIITQRGVNFIDNDGYEGENKRLIEESVRIKEKEDKEAQRAEIEHNLKIKSYNVDIRYKIYTAILGFATFILGWYNFHIREEYKNYKLSTQSAIDSLSKELIKLNSAHQTIQNSDSVKTK